MADVFDVTRAQLAEWENNWESFTYDEKSRDEGSRWLVARLEVGFYGRPFVVKAWADENAQDLESVCALVDKYNKRYLEDITYGDTTGLYECEVWRVVDAIPMDEEYNVTGSSLRELEDIASKLVYLFTKETGVTDLSFYTNDDGSLWGSTDHNEGYLWAAQEIRDLVAEMAATPIQRTVGYIEVYQRDEDDYTVFKKAFFDNEEEARADFEGRNYVPCGMHNEAFMVGHGPSFGHINKRRTVSYPNYWD